MAKFVFEKEIGNIGWLPGFFNQMTLAQTSMSATKLMVEDGNGASITYRGTGFDEGEPGEWLDGTVKSVEFRSAGGDLLLKITNGNFKLEMLSLNNVEANFQVFEKGGDTIVGSSTGDYMLYGANEGNDNISGFGGNDYILGSDGRNTIDGGAGNHDILTYEVASYISGDVQGIDANLVSGKIINPWGKTDTVSGIEGVYGTRYNDSFKGTGKAELFLGYEGKDKFTGGAGNDDFEIYEGHGKDVLTDFGKGNDTMLLSGFSGVNDFNDIKGLMSKKGDDVLLDFGGGDQILFKNVMIGSFNNGDFDFLM